MSWNFDGINDFVTIAANSAMNVPDADWTFACQIALNDTTVGFDDCVWFVKGSTTALFDIGLYQSGEGNRLFFYGVDNDGTEIYGASASAVITNTSFHELIVQRSGNTITMYLDGTSVASAMNASFDAVTSAQATRLGQLVDGEYEGSFANIRLAEIAFWTRALDASERGDLNTKAPSFFPSGLALYIPAIDDYAAEVGSISITNNGTTITTHPNVNYPVIEFAGSQTISFDGTADTIRNLWIFEGSEAVSMDGVADTVRNEWRLAGAETVSLDGTADTIRNLWLFDDSQAVSFDGTAALKQSAALTGSETVSFDGTAALDIAAIAFAGQGVLSFDGSIATLNLILAFQAQAALSFGGEARLGQEALFEGGGALSFDGLANLSAFQWEGVDVPINPSWQDAD